MHSTNQLPSDNELLWQELEREELVASEWFSVESRTYLLPNGKTQSGHFVAKEKAGVTIVAVTTQGTLLLVRQFRTAVDEVMYDFPGGGMDADEQDILQAAQRELIEETGYESKNWTMVGSFYPMPHRMQNNSHILLATDCEQVVEPNAGEEEFVTIHEVTPEELDQMIKTQQFCCGICQLAWYRVKEVLRK